MPEKKGNNVQDFFSKKERYKSLKQQQQQPGESSFRVLYYGGAKGSVPFLWESQPGTPKHTFDDSPLPPLTPPPSYRLSPHKVSNHQLQTRRANSKFFNYSKVFSRANSEKINAAAAASPLFYSPPSFSSSSSSSSSSRSSFSPCSNSRKESVKVRPRWRSVVKLELEDEGTRSKRSPTSSSTMCFGTPRFIKGYAYPVKKLVFSIVGGHRTG